MTSGSSSIVTLQYFNCLGDCMSHHTSGMPFRYAIIRLDMAQLPGIGRYVDSRLVSLGTAAHKETARSRPSSCRTN